MIKIQKRKEKTKEEVEKETLPSQKYLIHQNFGPLGQPNLFLFKISSLSFSLVSIL